jgi:hypothetical protein
MACGTPVAGFVAPGPQDIIPGSHAGAINVDLRVAALEALKCNRTTTRGYAEKYSWRACAEEFRRNLEPLPKPEKKKFWLRLKAARERARERRRLNRERREKRRAELAARRSPSP